MPKPTEKDLERVRKLAAKGMSAISIGREMGRTPGSISGICHRNGIKLRNKFGGRTKGSGGVKKKAPKPKQANGWVDPNTLSPEEREARAEAALEAEEKRLAALEEKLAAAADGALHLPLVSVEKVDYSQFTTKTSPAWHYIVTGLKRTTEGRPGQCRFAMTGKPPHRFCAKRCLDGSPWCPAHHDLCTGEARIPLAAMVKGIV